MGHARVRRFSPASNRTFEFIADAVVSLLDTIGEESAHLVGLSFGGMHALHTALRHADRVRTLTLVDTSPAFGADGVTTRDQWVSDRLEAIDSGATPADIAPAVMTGIAAPGFDGPGYDLAVASMGRIDAAGLRAAVNLLPDHEVTAQLGTITVPTLVVVGELDEETPPAYARALADGIADSEYLEVPGAGHLTPLEAPATFNAALRSFLTRERPAA